MEQLIEAVLKWLEAQGFCAVRRTPQGMFPQLKGTVAAVDVAGTKMTQAGLYDYLGMMDADGKRVSVYGRKMEAEVLLESIAPRTLGAKACMQQTDRILTALSSGIPGLALGEISTEACAYEADADCFSCKVRAKAQAYIYALANEEETEFTDFVLKGEVQ